MARCLVTVISTARGGEGWAATGNRVSGRSAAPAEDDHVLVAGVAADRVVRDAPAARDVAQQPLRREERGAPFDVLDAEVAGLAELRREPEPAAVQLAADLL